MERIAVIFLGPPGGGKGTQAKLLAKKYGYRHISTGDILREAVRKGTELGKLAKSYMDKGELVPDDVMIGLIEEVLKEDDRSVIMDGFPRTLPQAEAFDDLLNRTKIELLGAVLIDVPDEEIIRRLSARRVCPKCGAVYNMIYSPPKNDEICDNCGTKLIQRDDDKPETIKRRLEVYRRDTEPLVGYYREKGKLFTVNGVGSIEEITGRIVEVLGL